MRLVKWDLLALIVTIPVVILCFRLIEDRRMAAVFAGTIFVTVPGVLMFFRRRRPFPDRRANQIWWSGVLFFWVLFAWPILGVRLMNWERPFSELRIFSLPAQQWHQLANSAFMMMMLAIGVAGWMATRRPPPSSDF